MQLFLGLGSNEGDRAQNMRSAIDRLQTRGYKVDTISPVVESPALLPDDAPAGWNKPFLNLVVRGTIDASSADPAAWRTIIKQVEDEHGRTRTSRWAPRPLDIDILLWGKEKIRTETLTIPHPDLLKRSFVLTPLVHIDPLLRIPGYEEKTIFEWSLELRPIPLWMGVVNITPDSFSDGGRFANLDALLGEVDKMVAHGCHVIDLGAESTRPGARSVDWKTEWSRLEVPLSQINERLRTVPLAPRISVDTRNWQVASRALSLGVTVLNDVTALTHPEMQRVARDSDCDWVVMHHLTVPASPKVRLAPDRAPVQQIEAWLDRHLAQWVEAGVGPERLIFDPGIGFGKDSLQSLKVLRNISRLRKAGLRLLVGHSRKSFMSYFSPVPAPERDLETVGASLKLCEFGVDMLRVHNVEAHARAYRAWAHVEGFPNSPLPNGL